MIKSMLDIEFFRAAARVAMVTAAALIATTAQGDEKHTSDTLVQVRRAVTEKRAILLDVREPSEWKAGHLRDATSIPTSQLQSLDKLKELTKEWDKSAIVYTHCKAGKRALTCAPKLRELGFDVRPLKAGYDELLKAGFEKAE